MFLRSLARTAAKKFKTYNPEPFKGSDIQREIWKIRIISVIGFSSVGLFCIYFVAPTDDMLMSESVSSTPLIRQQTRAVEAGTVQRQGYNQTVDIRLSSE